jgi:hypothetical protein
MIQMLFTNIIHPAGSMTVLMSRPGCIISSPIHDSGLIGRQIPRFMVRFRAFILFFHRRFSPVVIVPGVFLWL